MNNLSVEGIDEIKRWNNIRSIKEEKIYRIDSFYDRYGNVISTNQTEIDESMVNGILKNINMNSRNNSDTHTTSMKKITLELNISSTDEISVTVHNKWLSIPSVKSYDIIAFRPISNYTYEAVNNVLSSAFQISDEERINYNLNSSDNVKKELNISGTGGYGVSMNIPNDVASKLEQHLTVVYNLEENIDSEKYFIVEGTYQHATSSVSLANSKKYSFYATGLGGVLLFNSVSIRDKYDNTAGLHVQFDF